MRIIQTAGRSTMVLAFVGLLAGCEQMQNALDSRGNRYCLQAGALGTAGGAAVGAGVGYAATGEKEGAIIGAVIGGLAGAFAGCQYGVWVADRRQSYETAQARLTGELANAEQTRVSLNQMNAGIREEVTTRQKQLAQLRSSRTRSQAEVAQAQQLKSQVTQEAQAVREQLQRAETELTAHRSTLASLQRQSATAVNAEEMKKYRTEVAQLEREVADLRGLTQQYASASGAVQRL